MTNEDIANKIRECLAEALQVDVATIGPDLKFGDIPEWDSLGQMSIGVLLEDAFGNLFSMDDLPRLTSVEAITEHILNQHR